MSSIDCSKKEPERQVGRWRVHVRVRMYGRDGRPWARESRPTVLPRGGYRSRASGGPSGRSVLGYVIQKVGRTATVPLDGTDGTVRNGRNRSY